VGADPANRAEAKREKEEGRKDDLRHAILGVLPAKREQAMTRDEIWEKLTEAVRVNRPRFHSVLEAEVPRFWLEGGRKWTKPRFALQKNDRGLRLIARQHLVPQRSRGGPSQLQLHLLPTIHRLPAL